MRNFVAATVAATLIATSAFAATTDGSSLAPGKPAGVQHAQDMSSNTVWWLVGLGVVAAGIGLVASGGNNNSLTAGSLSSSVATTTSSK